MQCPGEIENKDKKHHERMFVNLNDWVPARVAPSMKSEESTGDEEEDEEDDDTSDFHLDHGTGFWAQLTQSNQG